MKEYLSIPILSTRRGRTARLAAAAVAAAVILAACTNPFTPPTPTAVPTETPAPTATQEPTATPTPEPSATPLPTPTPLPPLAVLPGQVSSWCLPTGAGADTMLGPAAALPAGSVAGTFSDGILHQQVMKAACRFTFNFNQPTPVGLLFQVYDSQSKSAWLTVPLVPDPVNPSQASAVVNAPYLVEPPYWQAYFPMAVSDSAGAPLFQATLEIRRPEPNRCWDGSLPDPVTLQCRSNDGDWNFSQFPDFNPNADVFQDEN